MHTLVAGVSPVRGLVTVEDELTRGVPPPSGLTVKVYYSQSGMERLM